mgnify:CR=1 FL=1
MKLWTDNATFDHVPKGVVFTRPGDDAFDDATITVLGDPGEPFCGRPPQNGDRESENQWYMVGSSGSAFITNKGMLLRWYVDRLLL